MSARPKLAPRERSGVILDLHFAVLCGLFAKGLTFSGLEKKIGLEGPKGLRVQGDKKACFGSTFGIVWDMFKRHFS